MMKKTIAAVLISACVATCSYGQERWTAVPIVSAEQKAAGAKIGGEGGQWPRGPVAVSAADPNFLLLPIDVGGLYRSFDGGKSWAIAMNGWNARGANAFAIDPKNAGHVIGIAGNSMAWNRAWGKSPNGLYLSSDKAASWTPVLERTDGIGGAVAWDISSAAAEGCTTAYYLSAGGDLFQSDDAGKNWRPINLKVATTPVHDWTAGGSSPTMLAVDSVGQVWAAGKEGVFCSNDHGEHFSRVMDQTIFGFSLVGENIFACGTETIWRSRDSGKTFTALAGHGLNRGKDGSISGITASPVNPRRLMCWIAKPGFDWPRYVSNDGGENWSPVKIDRTGVLPFNIRQGYSTWSPTHESEAWSIGGDWMTRSTDGGHSFHWSNDGYGGVMVGGLFNFNPHHPGLLFLGFQDYNGACTTDGGKSWNYCDVSGKGWGGHEYGGFALNGKVWWAGDGESWNTPRHLRITADGGKHWKTATSRDGKAIELSGTKVSFVDPADDKIAFADDYRTTDGGTTWYKMNRCVGVFTSDPVDKGLYGLDGDTIIRSTDHGNFWQAVAGFELPITDVAVDHQRHRVYTAAKGRLQMFDGHDISTIETPKDQRGNIAVQTVAVDPGNPAVMYIGGATNIYATSAPVCRSTDAGKTWKILPSNPGPHEVQAIRVDPVTHNAWAAGQCFGVWKISAPVAGK